MTQEHHGTSFTKTEYKQYQKYREIQGIHKERLRPFVCKTGEHTKIHKAIVVVRDLHVLCWGDVLKRYK